MATDEDCCTQLHLIASSPRPMHAMERHQAPTRAGASPAILWCPTLQALPSQLCNYALHQHLATITHIPHPHPCLLQDPLADGPTIHCAATRALEKGTNLDSVIGVVREVSPQIKAPLVLFTYYNPIMRRGMDNFCRQIKEAGASGALPTCVIRCIAGHLGLQAVHGCSAAAVPPVACGT